MDQNDFTKQASLAAYKIKGCRLKDFILGAKWAKDKFDKEKLAKIEAEKQAEVKNGLEAKV